MKKYQHLQPVVARPHVWRAVRCCCTPTKVLGFMIVPEHARFLLVEDIMGGTHSIELKEIGQQFRTWRGTSPITELAIYSDDRPIEFWRGIIGFMEAKQ